VPNLPVDRDSRGRSACYPRGSFCPLRDGPATQSHRITKPAFRPGSRCPARRQAPLCLCTPRTLSNRAEGTLGRLRYRLGGDRPSQTAPLPLSRRGSPGRLDRPKREGGIPPSAPRALAPAVRSLPPILYTRSRRPIAGYSQAPRGLSVQSSVPCIFTGLAISPSLSLRQCPSRYAFRAGRNLPDKEFRYLRTVIVTAAVDWGFAAELAPRGFTFQHRAGVSPYTASSDFAGTCVFGKQSLGPLCCPRRPLPPGPLLPKVRGHFAEFLNESSLARLRLLASRTCVGFGYGPHDPPAALFSSRAASTPGGLPPRVRACPPDALHHSGASRPPTVPPRSPARGGHGISTVSPSTTPSPASP
jgi:hypothetical protein